MEKNENTDFLHILLNEEAWKKLSSGFEWTEELLSRYCDEVDWDKISTNENICWTVPMIQRFADYINWNLFSKNVKGRFLTAENIELFKDDWNWHELSGNYRLELTMELLEKFEDRWDWDAIINRGRYSFVEHDALCRSSISPMAFYERFKEHIPEGKLQNTSLWNSMIEEQKRKLICEIIA